MKKTLILVIILVFASSIECFAKTVKEYYPTGSIKYVAHYNSQNQLNGWYKFYYPNGQLKEQGHYKNDKLVGTVQRYYPDGSPIEQ